MCIRDSLATVRSCCNIQICSACCVCLIVGSPCIRVTCCNSCARVGAQVDDQHKCGCVLATVRSCCNIRVCSACCVCLIVGSPCIRAVSYTHLRANETVLDLVCRLLLENKKK